jgi:hypothetical protein
MNKSRQNWILLSDQGKNRVGLEKESTKAIFQYVWVLLTRIFYLGMEEQR